jgi:hypothetical protein
MVHFWVVAREGRERRSFLEKWNWADLEKA